MKTLRPFALALCAAAALSTARATTVIPPTFDDLVTKAELIFEGTVTDVKSQWVGEGGQRHIVSFVTVQVQDPIKGTPGQSYTFRMLGGTVGEDTMEVSDAPKFHVGDRDILFVENNGKQFIPLVGIMHGRFHLERDEATGADLVVTNSGSTLATVETLGREDATAQQSKARAMNAVERPLDAEAFKAAIRSKLADVQ